MLQPLELKEALTLACLVLEFEAESTQAAQWRAECERARLALTQAINRPPAGPFFVAPALRKKQAVKLPEIDF